MIRRERDLRREAEALGLKVIELSKSSGNHYRMVVESPQGTRATTFIAATPRCYRSDKNQRAILKRIASGATPSGHNPSKRGPP